MWKSARLRVLERMGRAKREKKDAERDEGCRSSSAVETLAVSRKPPIYAEMWWTGLDCEWESVDRKRFGVGDGSDGRREGWVLPMCQRPV